MSIVRPLATLALLVAVLPAAYGPARALPPHADYHPRLLFDSSSRLALGMAIASDPVRQAVWQETLAVADSLAALPPETLLAYYWGFQGVEELALVAQLGTPAQTAPARAALEAAAAWLAASPDPSPDPYLGVLGSALRLHDLVWAYDCAFAAADEPARQAVVDAILAYLQVMSTDEDFIVFQYNPLVSNKGIALGAQMLMAVLLLEEELPGEALLPQARDAAEAYLDRAGDDLFGAAGSYREGITYMVWSLRMLLPAWEARRRLEGAEGWEVERADRLLEWLAYQMLPEGGGAALNRNESSTADYIVARHHGLLEWATLYGTKPDFVRWLLRRFSGDLGHDFGHDRDPVATLLWHTSGPESAPSFLPSERFFADRGLYVYRRGWPGDPLEESALITLEGGRFMGGHAQEDVGQFTFRALGHGFALDNGAGVFAKQTEAHNLPTADGLGQHNAGASVGTDGTTRAWLRSPFVTAVNVDMREAYSTHSPFNDPDVPWEGWDWSWGYDGGNPMGRAMRTLLLFPGAPGELPTLFLRDDLIKDDSVGHDWRWRLHFDPALALAELGGGRWEIAGSAGRLEMFLHDPPRQGLSTSLASFANGNGDPDTRVFSVGESTERFHVLWQLAPLPTGAAAPLFSTERHEEGLLAQSEESGRTRRLLVSTGEAPLVTDAGERLEGSLAWGVIETEGPALRSALVQGRLLYGEGRTLVELSPAGSAAWDGEVLHLSSPDLVFGAYAPNCQTVLADGVPVPFEKRGDYVVSVGTPAHDPPEPGDGSLRIVGPAVGFAPLRFVLDAAPAGLRVDVYDVLGRHLRRLGVSAGKAVWDGRDDAGHAAPAGVYLLRARAHGAQAARKVLLLR